MNQKLRFGSGQAARALPFGGGITRQRTLKISAFIAQLRAFALHFFEDEDEDDTEDLGRENWAGGPYDGWTKEEKNMPKTDYVSIVPCLDTRDGELVKGVHFVDIKELGDPAAAGKAYAEAGADELVLLDITATLEGRGTFLEVVKRTVAGLGDCPLSVGGGIRSLEDMKQLFDLGVAKASVNSAAVNRPELIREAAEEFGSERIVVAIDTRNSTEVESGFEVVVSGGTKGTGKDAVAWAKQAAELGVGSILPTSMETDGVQTGYDLPMTRAIADAVSVPIIASGGAGTLEHLSEVVTEGHADAVLVASIAHFGTFTIAEMKDHLASKGIPVRR